MDIIKVVVNLTLNLQDDMDHAYKKGASVLMPAFTAGE